MCGTRSEPKAALLASLCVLWTVGCAALSPPDGRYAAADRTAAAAALQKSFLKTSSLTLTAYTRCAAPGDPLHLYIEGDGAAWLSRARLSDDPTPRTPLVLELAVRDPAKNLAYLARPGQYAADGVPGIDAAYWSDKRFSVEVVRAVYEAIDILKERTGARRVHLIGYSGGAAVAVLVAVQRDDVASLRTVAGNLDPEAVNRRHRVSPLTASLNPMDAAGSLRGLPQRHFVGSRDAVIPRHVVEAFVTRAGGGSRITVVEGATHTRGWRERWRDLLGVPPSGGTDPGGKDAIDREFRESEQKPRQRQ